MSFSLLIFIGNKIQKPRKQTNFSLLDKMAFAVGALAANAITLRELHARTVRDADCRMWMRQNGLLAVNMVCRRCGNQMAERSYDRVADLVTWRCPSQACRATTSVRKGSFFERSHVPLKSLLDFLYYWSIELPNVEIQHQLGIDEKTVTDWTNMVREVCSTELLRNPVMLGGPGRIVAVDETLVAKRKPGNQQGRPVEPEWVFGGVELGMDKFFMHLVHNSRDAATLEPIIQANVLPGTRIWSDQWAGYRNVGNLGYVHETVNHSQHFVDPATGVHTNTIECRWSHCKAAFKRCYGVARHLLPSYLDEHMWRVRHPRPLTFEALVAAIAQQYPV